MSTDTTAIIERPADLNAEWLTAVLGVGGVTSFEYTRIGTGQMSECYRVALTYADTDTDAPAGPSAVVVKVAAADPTSRQTGVKLGLYEREVRFYTELAPRLVGPVASCHHGGFDAETGIFDLILDDAAPAIVGDEIRGATIDQALLAVAELGRLHGPMLGDAGFADIEWLNREAPISQALISALYTGFVERYADSMTPQQRDVCDRLVGGFDAYLADEHAPERVMGLVHGDYRLDNMLFGEPGSERPLTVVDWQTVTWGPALTDLAYFLGCALAPDVRRAHYDELLAAYHRALGPDSVLTLDDVRDGVRRQSFFGVMMTIVSSMLVVRTERGDEMFMTVLERHCDHVLDTDAVAVLPAPEAPVALQPNNSDEYAHTPTAVALWNESWYADFADPEGGIGGWVRLGLNPNEDQAWINLALCGPGLPTIVFNDFSAALPADPTTAHSADMALTQRAVEPLQSYRTTVHGQGQAFDDPSAILRGEAGRPVEMAFDLLWQTVGTPYQYRITSRYEIPCSVTGTVTIDGHTRTIDAVAGQRDHSWGVRDWWSMDWVWSALHLDDGTHLHGLDLRIAGMAPITVGYAQRAGERVVELQTIATDATFGPDGLPIRTTLSLQPGDLVATADVVAHAPMRLVADDGRVSEFPRAWVSVTMADGRSGDGWMEWNRNR